jgi:hypothetical protein
LLIAVMSGAGTQTGNATANYPVSASLPGAGSQVADAGLSFFVDAALPGSGSQVADAGIAFLVNSTLSGGASYSSDLIAALALQAAFSGDTSLASDLTAAFALDSFFVGGAGLNASMIAFLIATLEASGSGFTVSDLFVVRWILANLQAGGTFLQANITWTPHPAAPPPKPSINGAATLQQFIDATGSGKSKNKTPPANAGAVDPNPPKKPFKPK